MQSRRPIIASALVGLLGAGALAGCGSSAAPTTSHPSKAAATSPTSHAKSPYVIPAILSLTGGGSFLGKEEKQALEALQQQVNSQGGIDGHPLQFNILDNGSDPSTAVSLASPLIAKNVPVILNGSLVATDSAVDKLATNKGPVIYDLSPGVHPPAHSFVYSSDYSTRFQVPALLNYCLTQGWTKIAAIHSNDASGEDGWAQLQAALKEPQYHSLQLVDHETFSDNAVSVATQITRMAAAHPQAIIAWATGTPIAIVFKGLAQSSLQNVPVLTTDGNQTYAQMKAYQGFLPKQLYFPAPQFVQGATISAAAQKQVKAFYQAFAAQGIKPDAGQGLAWDPALILINAIRHLGVHATATQIRNYIDSLKNFAGAQGTYNFSPTNHRGLSINGIFVAEWNPSKGTWVAVSGPGGKGH